MHSDRYITNTARVDDMLDGTTVLIQIREGGDDPLETDTTIGYVFEEADAKLLIYGPALRALLADVERFCPVTEQDKIRRLLRASS